MLSSMSRQAGASESCPELILHDSDPGFFAFYTFHDIMIVCWSQAGTGPAVQRLMQVRKVINDTYPNGVSVIHVIGERAGLPPKEVRSGVADLMERYKHQRACLAVLIKGKGFRAGAMRAVVTSTRLLVPSRFDMLISDRLEEVVSWLPERHERRTGTHIEPDQFRSVLKQIEIEL